MLKRHFNKKPLHIKHPQPIEEEEDLPRLTIKEKMEKYIEEMRKIELQN